LCHVVVADVGVKQQHRNVNIYIITNIRV